jgi:CTP:phosphocholine cytidylyltransferase-like protein/thiamine kinase-like enzyme
MKEQYEYLADAFNVKLLFCRDYMTRNNLYSLLAAKEHLENAYIVPCDLYFYRNPFHACEFYSWYLLSREQIPGAELRANRNREILCLDGDEDTVGNRIAGLAYIRKEDAVSLKNRLTVTTANRSNGRAFWELAVTKKNRMTLPARLIDQEQFVEINTYEQLRELDWYNDQLRNEIIGTIERVFNVRYEDIRNIRYLKKGLTNLSFLFEARGVQYIMRIPGWGTEYIDRKKEGLVYDLIRGRGLCDDNVYFNPENGFKIAHYLPDAHICDPESEEEVGRCLGLARKLHDQNLQIADRLDVFDAIQWYEDLRKGTPSLYRDYARTKARCMALRPYVEAHAHPACLTHGDCKPDNFLFSADENGERKLQLIDWEYAFNCDPVFDVAGFIAYRAYDPAFIERVIRAYWPEGCTEEDRLLLCAYCALWAMQTSNWCEHRISEGVDVKEFALICYRNTKAFCGEFEEKFKVQSSNVRCGREGERIATPVTSVTGSQ